MSSSEDLIDGVCLVKGIYVSWSNDPPNTKIQDWNVTELKVQSFTVLVSSYFLRLVSLQIDPHRRHVDKSVVAHFWKTLDTWTMSNKPSLMKA
jgi:parafibromin